MGYLYSFISPPPPLFFLPSFSVFLTLFLAPLHFLIFNCFFHYFFKRYFTIHQPYIHQLFILFLRKGFQIEYIYDIDINAYLIRYYYFRRNYFKSRDSTDQFQSIEVSCRFYYNIIKDHTSSSGLTAVSKSLNIQKVEPDPHLSLPFTFMIYSVTYVILCLAAAGWAGKSPERV